MSSDALCKLIKKDKEKTRCEDVQRILDSDPEAAGKPDKYGMYPLHYGMEHKAPADVIKVVLEACPEAAGKPDKDGKHPLNHGMEHKRPADVIKVVL